MNNRLVSSSGPSIVILLALVPAVLWWQFADFSPASAFWLSLGQIAALTGYSLFCLNFILSTRIKILEPLFSGLNRVYVFHHLVGAAGLILLLFHPLMITVSYLNISLKAAVDFIWPSVSNLPVYFGIAAMSLFIILMVLTLYVKLEYDFWKKTHKYLGLALFLASLHVFLIGSTLAASPPLKIYMLLLTGLAAGCFIYHTLLGRYLIRKLAYTVSVVRALSPDTLEISLIPRNSKDLAFSPGQFIFITPLVQGIMRQSHPFSLTSVPGKQILTVAAKQVGDFTATLNLLRPDNPVLVEGPFGRFSYEYFPHPKQLWIAGGIGITPFVSMAAALDTRPGLQVDFYYSVKGKSEAVYSDLLSKIADTTPGFNFQLHETSKKGRLTGEIIASRLPDLTDREIFLCGPPTMMTGLRNQFRKLHIPNSHIHSEEFSLG
ncbi:MAG: Membrane flavodoxin oxidoreductase [Candidatus Amesbacteria bacterium GW2011_GWB1_47_19]|nr:MAG: Membrane flavodoxin oxidoreductase [Candidatus Amesbacteria bacterium GW2011_GWA1_44_24]KKU31342.1 MAG: Membrane flavodoxin oxidoreductase [Candidatus Amesbacteria bacterium GW2011_GWC1_46_24]KKU67005.1 MAG: Membrane flavodoxin oxidoreductase [Candidatus Amesbacteria bacterium GW2011_GWB1_47_19]OGD04833.1 MAG: hypothetical protein A2379_04685 [Candidatus Amesbacteria bacterium RIFOXYB1_FULL_47_13]HBC72775.1 hypothetical protein [Candidatus Amesbacteria bacterium]